MNYYLVVSAIANELGLEDLSFKNLSERKQIVVTKTSSNTLLNHNQESATISKILSADYKLSEFNDGNGKLICDADNNLMLHDIASQMKDFTDTCRIEKGCIIGVSKWEYR